MKPGKNFHRGFQQWFWTRGQEGDPYALPDKRNVADLFERMAPGREFSDDAWIIRHLNLRQQWESDADTVVAQTMRRAARWVRDYTLENPFYLHVEMFDPHEPWDPPVEFARRYDPDYGDSLAGCVAPGTTEGLSDEEFAEVRAAYAGEVTLVDKWAGHLLEALRQTGHMEDTAVVFTSDHGCMMGAQGQIHKGTARLRNQVTRVPLLVRHPQGEAGGEKIGGFCQHQDIAPTVLDILDEPVPERMFGRSLWPPAPAQNDAPDYVVSGFCFHACIRTARWNFVRPWFRPTTRTVEEGRLFGSLNMDEELYDLEADPAELTNVVEWHPDVAKELSRRLDEHIERMRPLTRGTVGGRAGIGARMTFDGLPRLGE